VRREDVDARKPDEVVLLSLPELIRVDEGKRLGADLPGKSRPVLACGLFRD
jgi:hypothetical protein